MLDKVKHFLRSLFLFELLQGLSVTGRYLFRRKITIQYPEVKTPKSPRFRGMHALRRLPDGRERCVGCKLCQSACPANAIIIDSGENKRGERCALRYDIDQNKCIFCGFCEEACPTNAIVLTHLNEYHGESKEDLYFTKEILLAIGDKYEDDIARARSEDKDLTSKGGKG